MENVCFSLSRPAPGTRVVAKTEHVSKLSVWYGRRFQGHTRPRLTGVGQQSGPKAGFGRPDPDGPRPGPARKARDGPGFYKGALTFAFFSMFFLFLAKTSAFKNANFYEGARLNIPENCTGWGKYMFVSFFFTKKKLFFSTTKKFVAFPWESEKYF